LWTLDVIMTWETDQTLAKSDPDDAEICVFRGLQSEFVSRGRTFDESLDRFEAVLVGMLVKAAETEATLDGVFKKLPLAAPAHLWKLCREWDRSEDLPIRIPSVGPLQYLSVRLAIWSEPDEDDEEEDDLMTRSSSLRIVRGN
jgi:hypothetical protein